MIFTRRTTTNLLYNVQIPQESGFAFFTDNIGEIKFWGHEFSLTTKNTTGKLKWTTNANISFNRNLVVALAPGIDRVYGGTLSHHTGRKALWAVLWPGERRVLSEC